MPALVKVHILNGSNAVVCVASDAFATLAGLFGYGVDELRIKMTPSGSWVQRWSFRSAGSIVGRIEALS